jgi:hypothetical protein
LTSCRELANLERDMGATLATKSDILLVRLELGQLKLT